MISQMIQLASGAISPDMLTRARTSQLGGAMLRSLGERRTPGIFYISGAALLRREDDWYGQIQCITGNEPHLLTKTRQDLEPAAQHGLVTLAIDEGRGGIVVGCIVLWELGIDDMGTPWYELGTFVVAPAYRYKSGTKRAMPIADALYRRLLTEHTDKNILGTTTNARAVHIGQRHGMQMVSYDDLPPGVAPATCICPASKTLATDNRFCQLRDQGCRVRVTYHTWDRLRRPQRLSYP